MKPYRIPKNFAQEGVVLGFFKIRNLLEAMAAAIFLLIIIFGVIQGSTRAKVYMTVGIVLPVVILTLMGVQGLPLSTFLMNVIKYKSSKNIYSKPTARDKIEREKNIIKKKTKKIKQQAKEEMKSKRDMERAKKIEARADKKTRKYEDM